MKTIFATALLTLSLNTMAFEQTALLDFSNLYGNTNAGIYEMSLVLTPKVTLSEGVISYSTWRDDGEFGCKTSAIFEIGKMSFTLKNINNGLTTIVKNKVFAGLSKLVDGYDCNSTLSDFTGAQVVYSQIGLEKPLQLNATTPLNFKSVTAYLAPFNGYLNLPVDVKILGDKLTINPSELLTEKSLLKNNKQNSSVTYYISAQMDETTLSLGSGLIKFERE